ncbi:hypothetical protein PCASD_26901 [Puccinia coronata f. sp. avenae]|uniref:Uncharacterized protein n=1 Tax=Puccinia coronata f. sp. avenae TaxID=200324 RepID=A0A2N5RUS8_9BASI|nr:hypothetical protein PCASD_26901 [Puccinia coronata f. sp. avenae]
MLGSKKTSKAKTSDCVNKPEIQSLPPLAKPPTSEADDLAAQLSRMDSRYRTTLRTCQEAKQLDTLEIQIQEMAEAINSISNAINDLTTKISSAPSKDASASQTPKPDIDSGSPKYSFHVKSFLKDPMQLSQSNPQSCAQFCLSCLTLTQSENY